MKGNRTIGDEGGEVICAALRSSNYCKLESLNISVITLLIND